ncbi:hypothetical protein [Flammeovirga aprica]|uniref:Uncharacterized protein n=1 Tax=Flammeovirga aprica JL-4 TaxID=694437 RepID=A0A7X9P241_9BACT|nr:hypothetical protein [Flammeovirga aprica]NME68126.1 hypothetical protein [Flammeovirga aprica JL-4]
MEIVINRAGSLSISTEATESGKVKIYHSDGLIISDNLDQNGNYESEPLLEGSYSVIVSAESNGMEYSDSSIVQVIADQSKTVTLNPMQNKNDLRVKVTNRGVYDYSISDYVYTPIAGVNVGIVRAEKYWDFYWVNRTEIIQNLQMNAITNSSGQVTFNDLPTYDNEFGIRTGESSSLFMIIIMNNAKTKIIETQEVLVHYGDMPEFSLSIYQDEL